MRDSADFARLFRGNFRAFINFAFREIHAGKSLSQNWHIDVLADQLEQLRLGKNKRLIVNIPPRSLKSFCGSVSYPAFLLGRDPRMQIMLIAGTRALAKELSEKLLRLMSSKRYRALFPHIRLRPETGSIHTGHGGFVSFAVVGQQLSGRGSDLIVVDDPLSPARALDSADRDKVNAWFDAEVLTRMNDRTDGQIVVLMQRVHPGDLCGHLDSHRYHFKRLVIPSIAIRDEKWELSSGSVIRRSAGVALDPLRESREQQLERLHEIGAFHFTSQYLQGEFHPWKEHEYTSGCFHEVPEDGSEPDHRAPFGFYRIGHTGLIHTQVFGIGTKGPRLAPGFPPIRSVEEWQKDVRAHQRELISRTQNL